MELVDINPTRGKSPAKLDMAIPFPNNLDLGTNELQKPLTSKVVATPYVLKISNANGSNFIRHRHLQEKMEVRATPEGIAPTGLWPNGLIAD